MIDWIKVTEKLPEDVYDYTIKSGTSRIRRFLCYAAPNETGGKRVMKMCGREITRSGKKRWTGVGSGHTVTHWAAADPPPE